jgi:hypothetical protein
MLGAKSSLPDAGRAKRFRFAVTWSSLTAHLDPCEIGDPIERGGTSIEAATYVQPTVISPARFNAPIVLAEREAAPEARWEMVVPKMVRPEPVVTVRSVPARHLAPSSAERFSTDTSPSPIASFQPSKTLLLRALAAIGRSSRKLLVAPDAQSAAKPQVHTHGRVIQTLGLNAPEPIAPAVAATDEIRNPSGPTELALSRLINALNRRSSISDQPRRSGVL